MITIEAIEKKYVDYYLTDFRQSVVSQLLHSNHGQIKLADHITP